ncbi:MAG TPA: glycosyltransferase family 2 protein [Patescibacteria group bacterium]|nr:glycosyltransferase family 2 protein [Patescibacteria group bacterium]
MTDISVVILTKNEEKNIYDCLESVKDFDEIVVIDDNSTDRTVEVVKSFKGKATSVYRREMNGDFSTQRNFGLDKSKNDWVLFIDADERVSKTLFNEIQNISQSEYKGFRIRRADYMWGKELKHGETGNIKLVRLGVKKSGKWTGKVHEVWNIDGKIGMLDGKIDHYPHQTIKEFIKEIDFYSTLRAEELNHKREKVGFFQIIFYTKIKFIQNYFIKLGVLDGIGGFISALMMSFHSFLVRSKLYFLNNK